MFFVHLTLLNLNLHKGCHRCRWLEGLNFKDDAGDEFSGASEGQIVGSMWRGHVSFEAHFVWKSVFVGDQVDQLQK